MKSRRARIQSCLKAMCGRAITERVAEVIAEAEALLEDRAPADQLHDRRRIRHLEKRVEELCERQRA